MNYMKVRWIHSHPDDPILLYSELDENRWATRKAEVYVDGHCGYASHNESTCSTWLGEEPVPTLAEIAADSQFQPVAITKDDFEEVWANRKP
jgi:hypothetical protein